jgi:hypothetical protein
MERMELVPGYREIVRPRPVLRSIVENIKVSVLRVDKGVANGYVGFEMGVE